MGLRCREPSGTLRPVFARHGCTLVIAFHPWRKQNEDEQAERASLSAVLLRCTYAARLLRLGSHQRRGGKSIRRLSSSVCGWRRCTSPHVSKTSQNRSGGRAAVARRGAMLMLLNLSTVAADIKGQAGSSRWRFCRPVSPLSDSDSTLCERKLLTRLYCWDGGTFPRG